MDKKISCVLPVFNGEKFISKAIESIINQTYKNWELIIVDDCSCDNTPEIIKQFEKNDNRIKVYTNKENKKLPASLNIGFKNASGKYYTWTSDDNEYYPQAFEKMINFLENNEDYGMVYAQINVEKNGILQDFIWCSEKTTPASLLKLSIPGACFMYRSTIAKEVGEYDESLFLNEDHDYWLRILLKTKIANLCEVLYLYRIRKESLTTTRESEIKKAKTKLLAKYRKIYAKKFPDVLTDLQIDFLKDDLLENINIENIKKSDNKTKRLIYELLKNDFRATNDIKYLKAVSKLNIKYFIKAIILFLKFNKGVL